MVVPLASLILTGLASVVAEMLLDPEPTSIEPNLDWSEGGKDKNNSKPDPSFTPPIAVTNEFVTNSHIFSPAYNLYTGNTNITNISINYKPPSNIPYNPNKKLPKEADKQTPTQTPVGTSLTLQKSIEEHNFGSLLYSPLTNTKYVYKVNDANSFQKKIEEENQKAIFNFSQWLSYQITEEKDDSYNPSLWDGAVYVSPQFLQSLGGKIGLAFGIKNLSIMAQYFTQESFNAYLEVSGRIPYKYEIKKSKPKLTPSTTNAELFDKCSLAKLEKVFRAIGGGIWKNNKVKLIPEDELSKLVDKLYFQELDDKDEPIYKPEELEFLNLKELWEAYFCTSYFKAGSYNYPAIMPETLFSYTDKKDPIELYNYSELFLWYLKQFDGLMGEFPLKIDIKELNPETKAEETTKIEIPNIAEALSELYGIGRETGIESDIHTNFFLRLIPEILAMKTALIVTQDYAKANAHYLGYKGNNIPHELDTNFNLDDPLSVTDLLREKKYKIVGWQNEDKNTIASYLEKLMFAAGIIKNALFVPTQGENDLEKQIEELFKSKGSEDFDKKWDDFIKMINNAEAPFNKNFPIKPKAIKK